MDARWIAWKWVEQVHLNLHILHIFNDFNGYNHYNNYNDYNDTILAYSHHGNGIREDYDDNHAEEDMMIKIDVLIP